MHAPRLNELLSISTSEMYSIVGASVSESVGISMAYACKGYKAMNATT